MGNSNKYYEILGVNPNASTKEIKQAYRDLVKVWHPDRFMHEPRLQKKAQKKLAEINEAYTKIQTNIYHYHNTEGEPVNQEFTSQEEDFDAQEDFYESESSDSYEDLRTESSKTSGLPKKQNFIFWTIVVAVIFLIIWIPDSKENSNIQDSSSAQDIKSNERLQSIVEGILSNKEGFELKRNQITLPSVNKSQINSKQPIKKKSFSKPNVSEEEKSEQNISSSEKLKPIEKKVDNSKNTIEIGITTEEVLRFYGQPDRKVNDVWFYKDFVVSFDKGKVWYYLEDSGDSSQLSPIEKKVNNSDKIVIIGSTAEEVLRIHGQPEKKLGFAWFYGESSITIYDGKVIRYDNKGNLKTIKKGVVGITLQDSTDSYQPASNEFFIIGSASREVSRIQGQPNRIVKKGRFRGNVVVTWFYGNSVVTIANGIVIGYNNIGNLKTYNQGIFGIVKKIR